MYYKPDDLGIPRPYTYKQLRKDNPDVSFPKDPPEEMMNDYGAYKIDLQDIPEYDNATQELVEEEPVFDAAINRYKQVLNIYDIPSERLAVEIRNKRNSLLYQCDWTQLPDSPIADKEVWEIYRQNLRDISQQPEFPLNITWPQKPLT